MRQSGAWNAHTNACSYVEVFHLIFTLNQCNKHKNALIVLTFLPSLCILVQSLANHNFISKWGIYLIAKSDVWYSIDTIDTYFLCHFNCWNHLIVKCIHVSRLQCWFYCDSALKVIALQPFDFWFEVSINLVNRYQNMRFGLTLILQHFFCYFCGIWIIRVAT